MFHFYLEWYEHDPHRALRLVLDFLVTSTAQNPCPRTGQVINEHVLETLVLIITRKYPKLLTKSGLQCLDHFWTKRAFQLDDIARKLRDTEPSLAITSKLGLWRCFSFHLFSWMEQAYVGPLSGKCLVHVFRELVKEDSTTDQDSERFSVDLWLGWLKDAQTQYPGILEDVKNYVLVPIFKTDKASALLLLQTFNRTEALTSSQGELADGAFMLQLAALELGKRFGLVEEPSEFPKQGSHIVF